MPSKQLIYIKLIHTIIWIFFASIIFFILWCGIFDKITIYTWISIGLVLLEALTLLVFNWFCPLTLIARKYSNSTKDNFDIYLPNWIAKYNKLIFTSIFLIALLLVIFRNLI